MRPAKILQIGNHPPPMCGWAMQSTLVTAELGRRGHICEVMKINEGRRVKSADYVDVQNGFDYLYKLWSFVLRGYRLNVHVNGCSRKGYLLALAATITGRLSGKPARVTFHGGLSQYYFPRSEGGWHWAFWTLFHTSGAIACDSPEIGAAIVAYGISPNKVVSIATFSPQYMSFSPVALTQEIELFLARWPRIVFCYLSFRPEYQLETLRRAMRDYRGQHPQTGFVWLGFPAQELSQARDWVLTWEAAEREGLSLLGNLPHAEFLTLLSRSAICLRTPVCDGVAASVLEAVALGIPVVASENGRRPVGVVTYEPGNAVELVAKLNAVSTAPPNMRKAIDGDPPSEDNIAKMADWLAAGLGEAS